MLIMGDISGIQDFLFDIPSSGGGQARMLRARSIRLQMLADCAALKMLLRLGLSRESLLLCAAGKFVIKSPDGLGDKVRAAALDIEDLVLRTYAGRLRFAYSVASNGTVAMQYDEAFRSLRWQKLRPFAPVLASGKWDVGRLCLREAPVRAAEAEADREFGRQIVTHRFIYLCESGPEAGRGAANLLGFSPIFSDTATPPVEARAFYTLQGFKTVGAAGGLIEFPCPARHVPSTDSGEPLEFSQIANRAAGADYLAVLKADADNLGAAVGNRLRNANDLDGLKELSVRLHNFFARSLNDDLNSPRWQHIYCIFAGGDDLLLAGPWDAMLAFASALNTKFCAAFKADGLTLSAGISICKARRPIRSAVQEADEALDLAKTRPAAGGGARKNQVCVLGAVMGWPAFADLLRRGGEVSKWVQEDVVSRGALRNIFDLALLRNGQGRQCKGLAPKLATSRLAYHIGRNFGQKGGAGKPQSRQSLEWAKSLLAAFDGSPGVAVGGGGLGTLIPLLRYTLLATRQKDKGFEDAIP